MRQITINGAKMDIIKETNDIIICKKLQEYPIFRVHDRKEIGDIAWQDIQQKHILHTFERASFNVPMLAAIISTITDLNEKIDRYHPKPEPSDEEEPIVDVSEPVTYEPDTEDDELPF